MGFVYEASLGLLTKGPMCTSPEIMVHRRIERTQNACLLRDSDEAFKTRVGFFWEFDIMATELKCSSRELILVKVTVLWCLRSAYRGHASIPTNDSTELSRRVQLSGFKAVVVMAMSGALTQAEHISVEPMAKSPSR